MNRTRSPKYPNFSLRAAVKQAEKIFQADRRNVIDRLVAAQHMGYSGLSGPADKSIATLVQYGLLERVGKGEVRISQTAMDILHPDGDAQYKAALAKAAFHPEIFKALRERFPEGVSASSLASYLVRENFMDRAISPITKAYSETCALLEQAGANSEVNGEAEGSSDLGSFGDDDGMNDPEPPAAGPTSSPSTRRSTIAQTASTAPAGAHLSLADVQHLPSPGFSRAAFPLAEGTVYLTFPEQLTADGYAELKEYLDIFLRRAERAKRQQETGDDRTEGLLP